MLNRSYQRQSLSVKFKADKLDCRMSLSRAANFTLLVLLFCGALLTIHSSKALAVINNQINFQGKLTNPDGTNVTDNNYSIVFTIYSGGDETGGGSAVWTETQTVPVADGIFRVSLGSVTALPGSVDFNSSPLYLSIKVGTDSPMLPRVLLTASPYAFNSDRLDGIASSGFIQLGPAAAQIDSATNPSIFINKTGATGNIVTLQNGGTAVFTVANSGALTVTQLFTAQAGASITGGVLTLTGNAASSLTTSSGALTITSNQAATWSTTNGDLTIQAGSGTVSLGSSTILTASGAINITTGSGNLQIGTSDTTGTLLVLDTKTGTGDPSGVNGGLYYNSADNSSRCYEGGYWSDCATTRVLAESTLSVAATSISLSLSAATEYIECHLDLKGRSSTSSVVWLRFNSDSGGTKYGWNSTGIVAASGTDWQDNSDSEIQLSGTQAGSYPFSANVIITNFSDTNKVVQWTASGLEAAGTNSDSFVGVGGFYETSSQISSVQFLSSTGNFNSGSHAWCEGRNIR